MEHDTIYQRNIKVHFWNLKLRSLVWLKIYNSKKQQQKNISAKNLPLLSQSCLNFTYSD